jgi:hypothetical protein
MIKGSEIIKKLRAKDVKYATRERNVWLLVCITSIFLLYVAFSFCLGFLMPYGNIAWPISFFAVMVPFYFLVRLLTIRK